MTHLRLVQSETDTQSHPESGNTSGNGWRHYQDMDRRLGEIQRQWNDVLLLGQRLRICEASRGAELQAQMDFIRRRYEKRLEQLMELFR